LRATPLLLVLALGLVSCGSGEQEPTETPREAAIQRQHKAAESHCKEKGEIIAQGNDETTECVSNEQKEHEIERDMKSGPHYEAEQQANENEAQHRQDEEAQQIERERSGE
jgi:hypothetical protein